MLERPCEVALYLVALGVEIESGDSGVACLPEADELLGPIPLKHADTPILSSSHV